MRYKWGLKYHQPCKLRVFETSKQSKYLEQHAIYFKIHQHVAYKKMKL